MKKILLIFLIGFSGIAQIKHPETDFKLFEQKVYWEHIYNAPGKNINELITYFEKEVAQSLTKSNLQIIDSSLSFTINNDFIDFKKYGGTTMGTAIFLRLPMTYIVIVDFKDEKYKVLIKEITLTDDISLPQYPRDVDITGYFTKKKKSEFGTSSLTNTSIGYYHKYFTDKFAIKNNPTNKDW